ncbi:hypothetical protein ACFWIQ_05160 [Kitasatospora sp. NPDC127059]|uniref:hypothetical protein n=1 Tax=unclassified Kitasatospora TaxID=2633591 RepID=UPI003661E6AC
MDAGHADLAAFVAPVLADPDLVRRYRENLPPAAADPTTFYGGGEGGYTDHPFHRGDGVRVRTVATAADVQHGMPHPALRYLPPVGPVTEAELLIDGEEVAYHRAREEARTVPALREVVQAALFGQVDPAFDGGGRGVFGSG